VALNAPVVVELLQSTNGSDAPPLAAELTLTVVGATAPVELRPGGLFRDASAISFVPVAPLSANTSYRASFTTGQVQEPGLGGPSTAVWEFTTGELIEPTLTLEGELQVSLETGDAPIYTCNGNTSCGPACTETGQRRVTKARVKLPVPQGGAPGRLFGWLALDNDEPSDFINARADNVEGVVTLREWVELTANQPAEDVLVTLPDEAKPYTPCFAFKAWDARGDEVLAEPVCLRDEYPPPSPPVPTLGNDTGSAGSPSIKPGPAKTADPVEPGTSSAGCSLGGGETSPSGWALSTFVMALVAWFARARRGQATACPGAGGKRLPSSRRLRRFRLLVFHTTVLGKT